MQFISQMRKEEFKVLLKESLREILSKLQSERDDPDRLMSINEVFLFTGLAVATIYEKTSARLIPHYKQGKKLMFKKSEMLSWIESRKVATVHDIEKEAHNPTVVNKITYHLSK